MSFEALIEKKRHGQRDDDSQRDRPEGKDSADAQRADEANVEFYQFLKVRQTYIGDLLESGVLSKHQSE